MNILVGTVPSSSDGSGGTGTRSDVSGRNDDAIIDRDVRWAAYFWTFRVVGLIKIDMRGFYFLVQVNCANKSLRERGFCSFE